MQSHTSSREAINADINFNENQPDFATRIKRDANSASKTPVRIKKLN
jgi:hypothetical protein